MNDNLMEVAQAAVAREKEDALQLHADIMANMRAAASAMVEFCRELKEMRDKKLYTALGYESFDAYAEQAVGIRQRQAYTYIGVYEKLSPKLVRENAELGITKLALLTQVSAPDRTEFADENDLAAMSVKEIETLIAEKNGMAQQISMLDESYADAAKSEAWYKKQVEKLEAEAAEKEAVLLEKEAQLAALMAEPVEAQCGDAAAAETEKENDVNRRIEDAVEKAKAQAKKEQKLAVKDALDAKSKQMQAMEDELEAVRAEKEQQILRAEKIEKKLALESSRESAEFALWFEQLQAAYDRMTGIAAEMRKDGKAGQADKLEEALRAAVAQMTKAADYGE